MVAKRHPFGCLRVSQRKWLITCMMLCLSSSVAAQSYSHLDTVSQYPNFGTFYHDRFEGRKTASGEIFDQNKFTAAHWKLKLGTYVLVTNQNTGLQVIVKVNDRCPKHGVLDMTRRAAYALGIRGCQKVTFRVLPDGYAERCEAQDALFDSVPTRLVDGKLPVTQKLKSTPARPAVAAAPATTRSTVATAPATTRSASIAVPSGSYNLLLATVSSHGEAFELSKRLPDTWRERLIVDTVEASAQLRLTLDLRYSRQRADQLRRQLKDRFPQARVVLAY